MKGRKGINTEQKGIKGENPGISKKKKIKKIPPGAWISVSCKCFVLSGRGLCVGLITRPEESCRV
jgi:hypothetical protein